MLLVPNLVRDKIVQLVSFATTKSWDILLKRWNVQEGLFVRRDCETNLMSQSILLVQLFKQTNCIDVSQAITVTEEYRQMIMTI